MNAGNLKLRKIIQYL